MAAGEDRIFIAKWIRDPGSKQTLQDHRTALLGTLAEVVAANSDPAVAQQPFVFAPAA